MKRIKNSVGAAAIAEIAKRHGVSQQEVRREIQAAIDAAMANPDPAVRLFWASVPRAGKKPTPEEAIPYMAGQVMG